LLYKDVMKNMGGVMKHFLALTLVLWLGFTLAGEMGGISGIVTDSVSGQPIAGATVRAMMRQGMGGMAVTNQNGEYTIQNLRPGFYRVTASAPNYLSKHYPEMVEVVAGQITPDINFALVPYTPPPPPQRGGISGVVTDSITGAPIPNAWVSACGPSCGHALTDENGEYLIGNLLPGNYRVTASASGYRPKRYPEMVEVISGQITPNINFALASYQQPPPARGSISGLVIDKNTGEPIAGTYILAMRRRMRGMGRAITGPDGTYQIENLLPGEYQVMARHPDYLPEVYPELVVVREGQNTPDINFALTPRPKEGKRKEVGRVKVKEVH
jgi:protocatechuate 3,4-dioxygenase beta subunit